MRLFIKLLIAFPFITIIDLGVDTSPLLVFIIIVLFIFQFEKYLRIKYHLFLFTVSLFFFSFLSFSLSNTDHSFTNFLQYLFFIITLIFFNKNKIEFSNKEIFSIMIIYFLFGIIQLFIDGTAGSSLVPSLRSSVLQLGRGVASLNSEPSFYGITMLLFIFILQNKKRDRFRDISIFLAIFQIIFLSRSTLGILILIVSYFFLIGPKKLIKYSPIILLLLILPFVYFLSDDSRVFSLISKVTDFGVLEMFAKDESALNRLMRLLTPFYSSYIFFPGFAMFDHYTYTSMQLSNYLGFSSFLSDDNNRITGGILPLFHHFGVYGLIFIIYFFYFSHRSSKKGKLFLFLCSLTPLIIFNPLFVYSLYKCCEAK
tara:strand:- start:7402 stop:8511 length:1110 start_codon:yes stop_codon:yes gene_type:complete